MTDRRVPNFMADRSTGGPVALAQFHQMPDLARGARCPSTRVVVAVVAALAAGGCNSLMPAQPRIDCRTGDPASCAQAAGVALDNAPSAIGTPTQLIITTGGLPDCQDPRPIVCAWNVRLVYGEGNDTFSQDQLVMTTATSGWGPVRVVTMTPEPSPSTP